MNESVHLANCLQGCVYDEANTYVRPDGRRECRIRKRLKAREWARTEAGRETNRKAVRAYRDRVPERAAMQQRTSVSRLRAQVLDHYGRACACCGRADLLGIDHIDGNGREHRLALSGRWNGTTEVYRWLIKNGFPEGFQVLCRPCNASKGAGGCCRLDHEEAGR